MKVCDLDSCSNWMWWIVWAERRQRTRQQFDDLLQFLFESNLQDAVGLVDDQALQVLEHEARCVLRARTEGTDGRHL